ncbi:16S rRNA (guanine(527)-N(7))-methyltransferase RsmG [Nocardioides cynanchi]|uniref:16S rRNA (guanine(527)-N(7))-methyltransferase RsmG n=1 Tax=Nocardioides cynanchi TaxID=2558918 RepID=UPI00124824F7|nr:16S rRNA (guanine(527)-N(7))-methyltransferase RsmG [Nocardioides cynanchi]
MADVSRETPEPDPALITAVFAPDRLPALRRYVALLAGDGVDRGLIGPREVPRLWDRHVVNCGLLAPLLPEGARVADLGSGAGLPGLVLAIARPDLAVTLVEPMLRRTTFLNEACEALHLERVQVVRGRAQELVGERFDVVTARALAPLPKLLTWALPLVAPGGALLALKGSSAADEVTASADELGRWRASAEVLSLSVPGSSITTVVRVVPGRTTAIGWRPDPAPGSSRPKRRKRS